MTTRVETLLETDTIARAAAIMSEAGVGFLPICDAKRKVIGVVTDRDLVIRGLAKGLDPKSTAAALIMTSPALTCIADGDLGEAQELMAHERRSRIVVTAEDGTVDGVLSVADIIEHAPSREALRTARSVLWREALGPRGGAAPGQRLLKDYPLSPEVPEAERRDSDLSIFRGGHHETGTKEFP
jgi:signal-transduction protein with cAMP-binding, CBS, and nucleotidyltransferase domain